MIDLRKPLEGALGLLLMAALILFGATIGIAAALGFTWIPMSDALANFLGGVIGAGLGAALAIGGAVYVQKRDRRDQLTLPLNELRTALQIVTSRLELIKVVLEAALNNAHPGGFLRTLEGLYDGLERDVRALPTGLELPSDLHDSVRSFRVEMESIAMLLRQALPDLDAASSGDEPSDAGLSLVHRGLASVRPLIKRLSTL